MKELTNASLRLVAALGADARDEERGVFADGLERESRCPAGAARRRALQDPETVLLHELAA